jgi:uncharacterized cupin superfamily protein
MGFGPHLDACLRIKIEKPSAETISEMQRCPTWSKEVSVFDWKYDATETCYVLEGEVRGEHARRRGVRRRRSGDLPARPSAPGGAWQAKDFTLKGAYANPFRLADLKAHCPYVRAVADRIARDALDLQEREIGVIAVMPKDYVRYPEDAPEQMKHFAKEPTSLSLRHRRDRSGGPDLRRGLHSRVLRLQRRPGAAVSGPAQCVADCARTSCPTRAVRADVPDRRDRHRAGLAAIEHGLFDLMLHLRRSSGGW